MSGGGQEEGDKGSGEGEGVGPQVYCPGGGGCSQF